MNRSRQEWGVLVAESLTANCDDREEVLVQVLDPTPHFLEVLTG